MKTAKITNFFAKVPPPSKREDTQEADSSQNAALESTSGPVTSESSRSEVILSRFESSRSPTPIQPNVRRIRTSRAIMIESDTSDDEDEKVVYWTLLLYSEKVLTQHSLTAYIFWNDRLTEEPTMTKVTQSTSRRRNTL
jgi:hypothetical protein